MRKTGKMSWESPVILVIALMGIPKLGCAVPNFLYYYCSDDTSYAPTDTSYPENLHSVFTSLSSAAATSSTGFATAKAGNGKDNAVFGLFLCRGDQSTTGCSECVNTAVRDQPKMSTCPRSTSAIIWYDECMIRYDNKSFFGQVDQMPILGLWSAQNLTQDQIQFLGDTLKDLAIQTAKRVKKYGTTTVIIMCLNKLYVVEQCTPDLSASDCKLCLNVAIEQMLVRQRSRIVLPSCNVRYEVYQFYNDLASSPPLSFAPVKTNKSQVPIAVVIAIPTSSAVLILLFVGIWIMKRNKASERDEEIEDISNAESFQFNISTIRAATHNFSIENKLGEGGFGEVYKGKLESGQEVAVKRLLQNSKQGVTEFKTEVALVAKLQHKNLVKLLGFCVTLKEKILVYEYLPNSSLDRFLFDQTSDASLSLQTRLNIIIGIARGLMYLHEDSRLKVIHRDLKTSNILLDDSMNSKISDFGLARLVGENQTQGDTKRIVGTYGYMAPEYAITGHYSVKSDIYSFGVIVLEIISGQKNRFFRGLQQEEALLHRAWRLWNESKPLDLVDTRLSNDFPHEELIRCYHIGLLCIQEDAIQRPGMRLVLDALIRPSISLPEPTTPRFFGNLSMPDEGHHTLPHSYTGTATMTDVYPRD